VLPGYNQRWLALLGPWSVDQLQGVTWPNPYSRAARPWTGPPYHKAPRLGPRAFSISVVNSLGGKFCLVTASLLSHQVHAKPCNCSRRVAPIIERIDSGCASNPMQVLIRLTAPFIELGCPEAWPDIACQSKRM
jgi:hypothetical protein